MSDITFLTPEGKKQLEEKLKYMKEVLRPEVQKKIGVAREYGDLSENSEYDQAREEQGKLESEIMLIEAQLNNCQIITKNSIDTSKVTLGCTVEVYDEEFDEKVKFTIVGSTETKPEEGKISNESPVGQALMGAKKNDEVIVKSPAGDIKYKVLSIKAM